MVLLLFQILLLVTLLLLVLHAASGKMHLLDLFHECNDNARKQIVTIKLVPEDFGITHPYFPTPELRAQGLDPFIQDFRSSRSLPA